jgi:hypothetical protein
VLDGELIAEAEYARRRGRHRLPVLAMAAAIRELDRPKKVTAAVVSRVKQSVRVAARGVYTVGAGHASWVRRAVDALTYGPVREQVRLARLAGDREALAEWTERLVKLKDSRAERLRELPATLAAGLRALFVVACVLAGLLVVVGLWLAFTPGSIGWSGWWSLISHILDETLTVLSLTVLWCGLPVLFLAAWREGRRAAQPPRWLFTPEERAQEDAEITADVITAALRHVKVPAVTRYLTATSPAVASLSTWSPHASRVVAPTPKFGCRWASPPPSCSPAPKSSCWPEISDDTDTRCGPSGKKTPTPACWTCGSRTRARWTNHPHRGHCYTTVRSTSSEIGCLGV